MVSGMLNLARGQRAGDRLFATAMVLPAVVLLTALAIYPFLTAVQSSFYRIHTLTRVERFVGLQNYRLILQDAVFWASLGRSLVWTVTGVGVQLVLGLAVSLLLHAELRGRFLARGIVLFPYLVPAVVAALVWRFMLNPLTGFANYVLVDVLGIVREPVAWLADPGTALAAVIAVGIWKFTPFMVILFLARLQTTPPELYEAARIDGAGPWRAFRFVTLPWLMPTILVAALLRTIWMFNHFDVVYLMAFGGPVQATTTLPVLIRATAFEYHQMGMAAAISMCMVAILTVLAYHYARLYRKAEDLVRA